MCGDEDGAPCTQVIGDKHVLPVRDEAADDIRETFGCGAGLGG